jgi:hypothetical protein
MKVSKAPKVMQQPNPNPSEQPNQRLEDLEKKNIFTVPDRYFDTLPSIIQSRITQPERSTRFTFGWIPRLAFASVILVLLVSIWFYKQNPPNQPEALLAQVSSTEITNYLQDSDVSQSELMETVAFVASPTPESMFQTLELSDRELLEQLSTQEVEDLIQ